LARKSPTKEDQTPSGAKPNVSTNKKSKKPTVWSEGVKDPTSEKSGETLTIIVAPKE